MKLILCFLLFISVPFAQTFLKNDAKSSSFYLEKEGRLYMHARFEHLGQVDFCTNCMDLEFFDDEEVKSSVLTQPINIDLISFSFENKNIVIEQISCEKLRSRNDILDEIKKRNDNKINEYFKKNRYAIIFQKGKIISSVNDVFESSPKLSNPSTYRRYKLIDDKCFALELKDVFSDEDELHVLLQDKMRALELLKSSDKLDKNLLDNFYIDDLGLVFSFNRYSLLSRDKGYVKVRLRFDEIKDILNAKFLEHIGL